jgi:hypothetical protein
LENKQDTSNVVRTIMTFIGRSSKCLFET